MSPEVEEKGFTLIELMVVLVILGLLAGIAWPSYTDWRERSSLDKEFMVLKSALQKARSRSVQEGVYSGSVTAPTDSSVTCNRLYFGLLANKGANRTALIYFCDRDGDVTYPPAGNELYGVKWLNFEPGSGVAVGASTDLKNNYILFNKSGGVYGRAGTIWLTVGNRSRSVTVGNAGRISE